jgi:citrate/tricarballylate utilization protein
LPSTEPSHSEQGEAELLQEGARIMRICNACRYCEGYCAVFPAMELRQTFREGDLNYLANLCHNCSECYYACQYAPPHEFAVNVPRLLAGIRAESYRQYAWPARFARAFTAGGTGVSLVVAACLVVAYLITIVLSAGGAGLFMAQPGGDFYRIVPHPVMAWSFGSVSVFVLIAFAAGFARFWRSSGERLSGLVNPGALTKALVDVLTLRYLDGGGGGCSYPGERQSQSRRWLHHFTFYGFALCFASTSTAAFYHYALGWKAPYGYFSAPVLLGTSGGIALAVGALGLLWLKRTRNPETQAGVQNGMDVAFLTLLFLASITGLLLLALRQTAAMSVLLIVHLGIVLALFLTLPYGKFVHAVYRSAALVKYALERSRNPNQSNGGK